VSLSRYRRPLFAVLVVLALGGLYAAAAGHPASAASSFDHAGQEGRAAVSTAMRVCPAPGSAGVTSASVALAAMPGTASAGSAVMTRLVPGGSQATGQEVATATTPGVLQITAIKAAPRLTTAELAGQPGSSAEVTTQLGRGGVLVTASGAMAQGLEVEQTGPGGLVTAQCGAPGTNFWFVGPGQATTAAIELYLMNTGNQAADAQVSVLTDVTKGPPLLGNADNGISVPPHSMVVQSLGTLLQSSKVMALDVSTSVGQVVAAVRESRSADDDGGWLAPTQAPAKHLVIPGLPGTSGTPHLYIAVPGTTPAQLKITAVTTRGSYQPTGGTGLDLLGGSAVSIALPSLGGVPGAIAISSNVPVTAAMLEPGGPAGAPGAVAVSSGPVMEQGVLADNPARSAGSTDLVLSAPTAAATVRIVTATSTTSSIGQAGEIVHIQAGFSVLVPVKAPAGTRATQLAVIVTPLGASGPVYASRVISTGGVVQSIMPVPSSLTWIPLPGVQNSLSAILH